MRRAQKKTRKFFFYLSTQTSHAGNIIESANIRAEENGTTIDSPVSRAMTSYKNVKMSLKSFAETAQRESLEVRWPIFHRRLLVVLAIYNFISLSSLFTAYILSGDQWQLDPLNSGHEE